MSATLLAHNGAVKVSKDMLYQIEPPSPTASWQPIAHGTLVEVLHANLQTKGVQVVREEYAVQRHNLVLFGVMDLQYGGTEAFTAALGLRTSNDKRFALTLVAGVRVLICDNLALSGDMVALKRKHTAGLDLDTDISIALDRYLVKYQDMKKGITRLQHEHLTAHDARALLFHVFARKLVPLRLFPQVAHHFTQEVSPHFSTWDLLNYITIHMHHLPPAVAFESHTHLGRFFFHRDRLVSPAVPAEYPAGSVEPGNQEH